MSTNTLALSIGQSTAQGARELNEDFCAAAFPDGEIGQRHGAIAALADGISGGRGREAAESSVRGLLADYYAVPETWEVGRALNKLVMALNRWMHGQNQSHLHGELMCAFSALALRGKRYTVIHAGDTRVYLMRGQELALLTRDHVWDKPDMRHVLKRALGLDAQLLPDIHEGDLQAGDRFVLVCDGVWSALAPVLLHKTVALYHDPKRAAQALVDEALKAGSQDNVTALVLDVDSVPENSLQTALQELTELPIPQTLQVGFDIDGLHIEAKIHDSRGSRLYRVRDTQTGQLFALKTLALALADDTDLKRKLAEEEWLARRIASHYFPSCICARDRKRNYLYLLYSWHDGASLMQHLETGRRFTAPEVAQIGIRLLKGVSALHRLGILHRDIKPDNLHLDADGKLRILDLGVARCESLGIGMDTPAAGTPSFLPPESFGGMEANAKFDLYAAGVTLYHLLTQKYPYGEIEPFQHPKFNDPAPPTRYRPDIPGWLEDVLLKAVARDPAARFETVEEMLIALEKGDSVRLHVRRKSPLAERNPLALWQGIAALSLLFNVLLIYLVLAGSTH